MNGGDCLEMNKECLEARREYFRKWRAEHPESVKASQLRYWAKKAAERRAVAGIQGGEKDHGSERDYR